MKLKQLNNRDGSLATATYTAMQCTALQDGELHVELSKDERYVVFYPCCVGWLEEDNLPRISTTEFFANYTADNLFDLLNDKYNELVSLFIEKRLCQSPLKCNKQLELKPISNRVGWLNATASRACNLNCIMCDISRPGSATQLRLTLMLHECIKGRHLRNFSPTMVGEPFALSFFPDWCKTLTPEDTEAVTILTNGMLCSPDMLQSMHDAMKKNGVWLNISVSIDSAHKKRYESIRKGANFDTVLANTLKMKELGILNTINYLILPGVNEDEVPTIKQLFEQLGLPEPYLLFEANSPLSAYKTATLEAALDATQVYNRALSDIAAELARRST